MAQATNYSPTSINASNYSATTLNASNYAGATLNAVNYEGENGFFSDSALLLQDDASTFLMQGGSDALGLQS